ncbi:DotG/IcmE/VirB10 family protein [Acidithiobacillus sp. MC6.1]|nr:DotG/IcmE/VirB10 family protein [Acidithiobacillus sp. MC6.1]
MADQNDQNQTENTANTSSSSNPVTSPRKTSFVGSAKSWYTNPETRKTAIILTAVAVLAIGVGGFRMMKGPPKPVPDTDQVQATHVHGAPGGSKGSNAYNHQLAQANHTEGLAAAQKGQTYLPTPTALHPTTPTQSVQPKPASKPVPVVMVKNPYTPQQQAKQASLNAKAENAVIKSMENELKRFDANTPYQAVAITSISKLTQSTATVNSAALNALKPHAVVYSEPGYLAYAMLDSAVNSNQPGPILATIESGKYRGARLLGQFKRVKQADLLNFSEMTWHGHAYSIGAYAVSPKNEELGLATSVNNHTLYRYGWLFAGAFLQGLDQAIQMSSQQVAMGNGFAVVANQLNNGQILESAGGNIGNAIVPIAENRFNMPPTVRVAAGTGLGILFMTPVKGQAN